MIELSYDDNSNDVVEKINEELSSHNLSIEFDDDVEDDSGTVAYKLVKIK